MNIKKIAFFVEGYTEQEFLKSLLTAIFNQRDIGIEISEAKGGKKIKISYTTIESPTLTEATKYYVLIYNCGGDGAIKSYIMDRRSTLIKSGFDRIIGFRDVYPDFKREEIQRLISGLYYKTPQKDIAIKFILSVMEVEGWFLADENHYSTIDNSLSTQDISNNFGFDPATYNTELIDEPAVTLKAIYQTVGKTYKKEEKIIDRTIDALDYANLYFNVNSRIPSFKELTDEINQMFEN
jgi:hypothetical protein